jgi:hypothetical protein
MRDVPLETRAFRQRLMAGLLGFLLGLVALLGVVVYVAILVARLEGWGRAIHLGLHLVVWSVIGAMAIAWLATAVTDRIHARLGWLRCHRCGGRLRHGLAACACDPEWAAVLARGKVMRRRCRRHRLQRYGKRLPSVVFSWLVLLLVAYVLYISLNHGRQPTAAELAAGHCILCGLVVVLGVLLADVMKSFNIGKRVRPRAMAFLTVLAAWPIAGAVCMLCKELLR